MGWQYKGAGQVKELEKNGQCGGSGWRSGGGMMVVKRKEMRRAKWSGKQVESSADIAEGNINSVERRWWQAYIVPAFSKPKRIEFIYV